MAKSSPKRDPRLLSVTCKHEHELYMYTLSQPTSGPCSSQLSEKDNDMYFKKSRWWPKTSYQKQVEGLGKMYLTHNQKAEQAHLGKQGTWVSATCTKETVVVLVKSLIEEQTFQQLCPGRWGSLHQGTSNPSLKFLGCTIQSFVKHCHAYWWLTKHKQLEGSDSSAPPHQVQIPWY